MLENNAKPALGILKLVFGKKRNDKWAIEALQGISLKPRKGDGQDFFAIEDGLFTAQPAFLGTIKFVLGQSIVPIVAHVPGEKLLRCLGTGFFVSCTGLLVTAAHVITDPIERQCNGVKELDDQTWHLGDLRLGVM